MTHPNPDPLRSALEFYADGKRYGGPNRRRVDNDPYTHPDASYMKDVTRDGGDIARAALASAPQGGEWRTMKTFPRDGEAYLVCDRRILDGHHQVVFWDDEGNASYCLATSDGPSFHFDAFTHWQPLPAPPAVEKEG